MNDAVEMITYKFQENNITVKLVDDFLSTSLTEIVIELSVNLKTIFNSEV